MLKFYLFPGEEHGGQQPLWPQIWREGKEAEEEGKAALQYIASTPVSHIRKCI